MYLRYSLLVLVSLSMSALNYLLAPIAVLFASEDGWLPKWLWWLQTPGDSLDKDYRLKRFPGPQTGWKRWFSRTAWLYRNSMYGFCIDVLGASIKPTDTFIFDGDRETSNRPLHDGSVRYEIWRNGKCIYFQWYYVKRWSSTRCLRINIGWKIWHVDTGDTQCQLVFSPNPFMGWSE